MNSIILVSLTLSFLYFMSSHPVLLMVIILGQTLLICTAAWLVLKISWFSYILFLIFLGGLMVLFVYITSLASNEAVTMQAMKFFVVPFLGIFVASALMSTSETLAKPLIFDLSYLNPLYTAPFTFLASGTMVYLLLTLIVVAKMTSNFNAPVKTLIS